MYSSSASSLYSNSGRSIHRSNRAASFQSRRAAVTALGRLAEGTANARRARERLEACLFDPDFRVRMDAASALAEIGDARSIAAIDRARAGELDGRAKRRFRNAILQLREKGSTEEKLHKLGNELERLRSESSLLRERLEKVEAATKPSDEGPSGKGHVPTPTKRPRPGGHRTGRRHQRRTGDDVFCHERCIRDE